MELLNKENITIIERVHSWQEAIQVATYPLIHSGCVEATYREAIINNVKMHGKSFVISPFVILPHARPQQGVIKNGVSIVLLKKPCYFMESSTPIKLIVVMASLDSRSHLSTLQSISSVLNEQRRSDQIINSCCVEELYDAFIEGM